MESFCYLIHKINGRVIRDEDLSDEGIKELIRELSRKGLIMNSLRRWLNSIKKKN
jgi:hypothetical protein